MPRLRLPAMLRALSHRNYRILFFTQLISVAGVWMQSTAQGWLVHRLTDSPFWLGMVAAAQSLPVLLLSLPAGAVADRTSKRKLLLITQSTAMVCALLLTVLTATGTVQVWMVLLLALAVGVASAFEGPARQSFTIELVGREDLLNAIGLDSTMFNGARVIGPAVAGVVAATVGEAPAFLFNGLTYIFVIVGLLMMRLEPFKAPPARRRGGELREGVAYIARDSRVRLVMGQLTALCMTCMAYIPLLPAFASDVLHGNAVTFGWLASSNAAGALTAAVTIAGLGDRIPRRQLRSFALLLYPLALAGFTLSRSEPLSMLLIAVVGWCGITTLTLSNSLLQVIVPNELRGRVLSVYTLIVNGVVQLAGLALGSAAELAGDVAVTVRVSAAVGWLLQLGLLLWQGRALVDAAGRGAAPPAPPPEVSTPPGPRP